MNSVADYAHALLKGVMIWKMTALKRFRYRIAIFVIIFITLGVTALLLAEASTSTPASAVEAEAGVTTSPAHTFSDQTASNQSAVAFAANPSQITQKICGTWALQQADNYTDFYNRYRFTTANAMSYADMRGFSFRLPWNAAPNNTTLVRQFEQADELINQHAPGAARQPGKDYSIRFMAGRWTPQYVFDSGAYYYTLADGTKVPKPFSDSGQPGNPAFENAYRQTVAALATWARSNGVSLLHLPWYGKEWAELSNSADLQQSAGYSYSAWLEGHKRLIDIALEYTGPHADGTDLSVEFPMSGAGRIVDAQMPAIQNLIAHINSRVGNNSPQIFIQANGWGPSINGVYGDWGALTSQAEADKDAAAWGQQVLVGEQAIQGESNYNWDTMYSILRTNDAKYAEVYVASFRTNITPNTTAQLQRNITSFRTQVCN